MKQVLLLTIGLKNSNEMCFTNDESQGDSPSNLLHKKTPIVSVLVFLRSDFRSYLQFYL